MREPASRDYAPYLSYAAAALFLLQLALGLLLRAHVAAHAVHLVFVPVLTLLVMLVPAPPWARLAGYAWAALALVGDLTALISAALGGAADAGALLAALALLPGAAWMYGASLADEGAGRTLGAAAAGALLFSALLGLVQRLVLVASWDLGAILAQLGLGLAVAWFVVLARDLQRGGRRWGGMLQAP